MIDRPRLLRIVKALGAGCAIAIVFLAALEGATRLVYSGRRSNVVPHPILNHRWRPNYRWEHGEYASRGIPPYTHHYNRQGWLGTDDIKKDKPADTFRIFYLGDSFTEGTCPMPDSVPSLVEEGLQPIFAEKGMRVEVVNTGTSSYSPILYSILLSRVLLDFSPDLIVVNVDMSDVFDDFLYRPTAVYDEAGALEACPPGSPLKGRYVRTASGLQKVSLPVRAIGWLAERSRFIQMVGGGSAGGRGGVMDDPSPSRPSSPSGQTPAPEMPGLFDWCQAERDQWSGGTKELVAASMQTLRSMFRTAEENGIRVVATGVPHLQHFEGVFTPAPFEAIREACEAEGVPYLDSFGAVKEEMGDRDATEFYIRGDMHFNLEGYRAWAAAHLKFLTSSRNGILGNVTGAPDPGR